MGNQNSSSVLADTKDYDQARMAAGVYLDMPNNRYLNPFCNIICK